MDLTFDLNDDLRFDNFQTLSMNLNKNSPSATVLRGKGSLHSAENFVFSDKLNLSFTLSEEELVKMYNVYAMYRSKGMVFISSKEIFNKVFPHIEQKKIETLKTSIYDDIENIRDHNRYSEDEKTNRLKETATFLIKYRMVGSYDELKNFFSLESFINESFYEQGLSQFSDFTFNVNRPFLTMLQSMTVRSIVSTSNGYQVDLSLVVLDEIIDEATERRYKTANANFYPYFLRIEDRINSLFSSKDLRLNIYSIDEQIASFKTSEDSDQNKAAIEMKSIPKHINFNQQDISEFEVITYNNIADIPIQGRSKPIHQYLGVGESNFTIRLFYKNNEEIEDDNVLIRKIKQLQDLAALEQRTLKIDCEFGVLNALDLNGVQVSDIHFSNDPESDGFMVSIIFKVSGYANNLRVNEVNVYGEKVNEMPYHRTKTEEPTQKLYIERAKKLCPIFNGKSDDEYEQIVYDRVASTKYTYKTLLDSYGTLHSRIADSYMNHVGDIVGIRSLMSYIEKSFDFIISETLVNGIPAGYWKAKPTLRSNIKNTFLKIDGKFYEHSLNVNNAMFPSDVANNDSFLINECMKTLFQTYLSTMDDHIFNLLESRSLLKGNFMITDVALSYPGKIETEEYKRLMLKTSIRFAFTTMKEILHSEQFLSSFREIVILNNYVLAEPHDDMSSPTFSDSVNQVKNVISEVQSIFDDLSLFDEDRIDNSELELLTDQMLLIMNIRRQGLETYLHDRHMETPFYNNKSKGLYLTDPLVLGLMSVFSYNYGINNSYYGQNAITFFSKFIDIGIEANSLLNSLPNDAEFHSSRVGVGTLGKDKIDTEVKKKILDKIYGPGFTEESDLFYRPLTSNVALTDLGSYLGLSSADFHSRNKVLYKELVDSLDYKNLSPSDIEGDLSNSDLNPYETLVSLYKSFAKENTTESKEKLVESISDMIYDEKEENGDDFSSESLNAMVDEMTTTSSALFREFDDTSSNLNQTITRNDFRMSRYDSFLKTRDNIVAFEELYSSDLLACIPTYDVFVTRESSFLNLNTFAETLKVEDFLGIDKLASMNIQFTEKARGKTATFTFIDTTEDVREYGDIPVSYQIREFNDPSSDDPINFVASKTRHKLRVGDGIHIRMGFNNDNTPVFNGNVLSISEGKIKQVVCVSHVADLENETFNIRLRDGLGPISAIGSLFGSKSDSIISSMEKTYNSRVSNYVNNHIIFDNISVDTISAGSSNIVNYSVGFRPGEEASTFNMVNTGIANSIESLYHFADKKGTTTNLALGIRNKSNFVVAGARVIGEKFNYGNTDSVTGVNSGILANINNVDRDFIHYGLKPLGKASDSTFNPNQGSMSYIASNAYDGNVIKINNDYLVVKGSSFVDAELKKQNTKYKFADYVKKNVTLKDVLEDAEKRSPGSYFNVLENGFHSSLFYGRSNYNLDLHDPITSQTIYSSHKALNFLKQLEVNEVDNFNTMLTDQQIDVYKLFVALTDAVGSINPTNFVINPESYSTQKRAYESSSSFEDKFELEKASNVVYAVTGKNLISNKIILNDGVSNKITVDFKRTIAQTTIDAFKLDWRGKTSIYSSPSLKSVGLNHRVKEKVIIDSGIKQLEQAYEVAQSHLQSEMEKTYDGRITILFNPNIRYRTELKIFDTVNQIYGSVMVKDFEHKFDSRGSYTIITPMMKVEQNLIINELSRKSFWHSVFFDGSESKRTRFAEELGRTSLFFRDDETTGPSLPFGRISEIINQDINKVPLIVGDTIINHDDEQSKDNEVLKLRNLDFMVIRPLDLHPLASKGSYMIPDEDVYLMETRTSYERLWSTIARYTNSASSLFRKSYRQQSSLEENLLQMAVRFTRDRFSRLYRPDVNIINEVSTSSLLGTTKAKTGSVYGDVRDIITRYDITNKYGIGSVKGKYVNQGSVAFWNVKVLMAHEDDRINKIADVISNFDVCGITELCGAAFNGSVFLNAEGDRLANASLTCHKIVARLNEIEAESSNSDYEWRNFGAKELRKNAQVIPGHGVSDEFGAVFYRTNKNASRNIFNITEMPDQKLSFPVEWDYINSESEIATILKDESNVTITLQSIMMEKGPMFNASGLKKVDDRTLVSFYHNIFSKYSDNTYFGSPISRASGLKAVLDVMTSQNMLLLGDFNMTLYNGFSLNVNPILGSTAALFNKREKSSAFDSGNLLRFKTKLIPLIAPQHKTTLSDHSAANAYDQVLATNLARTAGVFRDIMEKDYKTTRDNISDHFPVFTRCLN